jgi:hypothetical protein
MPRSATGELPNGVRAFLFHGADLRPGSGDQYHGECPFCGRAKFFVNKENTKWDCKGCPDSVGHGNDRVFLKEVYDKAFRAGPWADELAAERGVSRHALAAWGVRKSSVTGDVLIPAYTHEGKLATLFKYARPRGGEKKVALATPGFEVGLFGPEAVKGLEKAKAVYLCEGAWDGMCLEDALRGAKAAGPSTLVPTFPWQPTRSYWRYPGPTS